ncbi:hypothetical protein AAFC00_003786 [Neodothiora populina]|uniref:Thioesterase-like superfamily-domain-containing protein n=1 Tax=Neodothiora populina TaxID=2781224 RepID=A0ABR3PFD6_9PEZI
MYLLSEDTKVEATSSHTYSANFPPQWCVGSVPNGGFVATAIQKVVLLHFSTTLKQQNQPHTLAMHITFLRRTQTGPANFTVKHVKIGRANSTVHVTLSQAGREEVVAYITNTNLATENGLSYPTNWSLHPAPSPMPESFEMLDQGRDSMWFERAAPFSDFRKAAKNIRLFHPRAGQAYHSIIDQWMTLTSGEHWTNDMLGLVVDIFPQIIESYKTDWTDGFNWYPTVLLNLDVKKLLPDDGVKWLFLRTRAKVIKGGRYDLEVTVMDQAGDLVASSNHVVMIVESSRNLAKRTATVRTAESAGSKL